MEDASDYIKAWAEEDQEKNGAHPVTEAVAAAKKADDAAFEDAFENDRFGLDIDKAKKKTETVEAEEDKEGKQ